MYSRLHDSELRKYLLILVAEGLIREEKKILSQDNPSHASRMTGKNRANATKTVSTALHPKAIRGCKKISSSAQYQQMKQRVSNRVIIVLYLVVI